MEDADLPEEALVKLLGDAAHLARRTKTLMYQDFSKGGNPGGRYG